MVLRFYFCLILIILGDYVLDQMWWRRFRWYIEDMKGEFRKKIRKYVGQIDSERFLVLNLSSFWFFNHLKSWNQIFCYLKSKNAGNSCQQEQSNEFFRIKAEIKISINFPLDLSELWSSFNLKKNSKTLRPQPPLKWLFSDPQLQ